MLPDPHLNLVHDRRVTKEKIRADQCPVPVQGHTAGVHDLDNLNHDLVHGVTEDVVLPEDEAVHQCHHESDTLVTVKILPRQSVLAFLV